MNTAISNYQQDFSPTWIDKKKIAEGWTQCKNQHKTANIKQIEA